MIALASDHGAFDLKEAIKAHLDARGLAYKDFGCYDKSSCDYPDFAGPAAKAVASGECEKGIVVCTTGIGVSITANKVKGVRCALLGDLMSARLTREHGVERLVMGCPRNMDGSEGPRAELYRTFAARLAEVTGLTPVLWDERRTTIEAHQILSAGNYHGKKRKNTVDAVAASLILEGYLSFLARG